MNGNPENDRSRDLGIEHKHGRLDPPYRSPEPERSERDPPPARDDTE
jgi:hypothetical protein